MQGRYGQTVEIVPRVSADVLEQFMVDVFTGVGVPIEDAKICAEVLIAADLAGIDSHGISRLKPIYYTRIKEGILSPITKIDIVREGPTTAVLDGNNGMGHVIAKKAMEIAIEKASEYGMGMVAVRNSSHYGIAGYYTNMAADAGMIGVSGTNARPSIAPTFGVENMLGTNPLAFAMPSDEPFPFSLDCATSTAQRGKIEVYARHNRPVPEGWVIGHDGQSKTDPHEILKDLTAGLAALSPLGGISEETAGYKGYGYATVVEILSAALQGGPFLKALTGIQDGKKVPHRLGHFFIAIDISAFTELEEFKRITGEILRQLRASKKAPGHDRIYTAGEKEYYTRLERSEQGIPIGESLQKEIKELISELSLEYDFPF
ncbi:MAG: Ldh family oxidoreductase [Firmicutes bacterium]|jgi:L-2-hydroxycarboxylate dehydrogenase (NAD+)|nr:Ldh family oxidoreductase [Bacillota bacterium]